MVSGWINLNKMKSICILLTLSLLAFTLTSSQSIDDTNVKCMMNCDLVAYSPVCGTDDEGQTRTFNNLCILKTENCLRNLSFQKTANGPCP